MNKVFLGNKVGQVKDCPIMLSDEHQMIDSIIAAIIKSPVVRSYFSQVEMDSKLTQASLKEDDQDMHLLMEFNNKVQMLHFSHDSSPVFIKDIVNLALKIASIRQITNSRNYTKKILRLLANSLYKFRVLVGDEQKIVGGNKYVPSETEASQIDAVDKLGELYDCMTSHFERFGPQDLYEFLVNDKNNSKEGSKILEILRFTLSLLFKEKEGFTFTFNLTMQIYMGLPFFYLIDEKLDRLFDFLNEKFPDLEEPSKSDPFALIISAFQAWIKDILKYIQILKAEKINVYERRDQLESYSKIDDFEDDFLDFLHIPITKDFTLGFIKFNQNCALATKTINVQIISDYTQTTFPNVIIQEKMRKDPQINSKIFSLLNEKVLNTVGAVFIGARSFSKTQVEYEYLDQMQFDFYKDNNFKYFRVERLKLEKIEEFISKGYKIIFFQITDELTVPYLAKPDDTLLLIRGQISNILWKFKIVYQKEEVLNYVLYNGVKVNQDQKISQYFPNQINSAATVEGMKKAPVFVIVKPQNAEPISNDFFNSNYFIKEQSKEILTELKNSVKFEKINREVFTSDLVVFDYTDDRYDVIPEQLLNVQFGPQTYNYALYAVLTKELADSYNLYFFDNKALTFENSNKNEKGIAYSDIVKKYVSFGFYKSIK